nr:hypothetical protein [Bradyrhizobium mercantei]
MARSAKKLGAQARHPWRASHVAFHDFLARLVTHVFVAGDQYLDSDVAFGVKDKPDPVGPRWSHG